MNRKEKRERAEKKRLEIMAQITDHLQSTIEKHSVNNRLNMRTWEEDANAFVSKMINRAPQDAGLIQSAATRVAVSFRTILKAHLDLQKEKGGNDG